MFIHAYTYLVAFLKILLFGFVVRIILFTSL